VTVYPPAPVALDMPERTVPTTYTARAETILQKCDGPSFDAHDAALMTVFVP